ncbi:hypothetical protein [Streptomyces sp. NL15-2K]|uniref:hypothetical protein n=1 Tax=Streptomyces sp. NL15-2K TaxID=376149 RepID=UPI000F58E443|nr:MULTISPECIES: hypothetical protein [Actinomycetes]WKX09528.1 hypothetical protein Q4V64_19345 [Kutzneria buriramensis]GCB48959.1 cupin family protein [Streptomyces sp. NL15-2K]
MTSAHPTGITGPDTARTTEPRPIATATDIEAYWRAFVPRYWERKAGMLGPAPVDLDLTGDWFFRVFTEAAHAGDLGRGPLLQLSVAGQRLTRGRARFLPRAEDGGLGGYLARMDALVEGAEWSVALSRLHSVSYELWERAARFLEGLWRELGGFPSGFADTDIFLGRYASSAAGIHCDNAGNFMFGLTGPKKLVVWPPQDRTWLPLHRPDWSAVADTGQVLPASRTDLGYFPSQYWHVGASPEHSSAQFNIAMFFDGDPVAPLVESLTSQVRSAVGPPSQDAAPEPPGTQLPPATERALDSVWPALDRNVARDHLLAQWLKKSSAQGFGHLPPPLDLPPVRPADRIRLRRYAVLHSPTHDGSTFLVAANGHLARLPAHPALPTALDRLNEGGVTTAKELAREQAGEEFADILAATLYRLRTWRAIDVLDDGAEPGPDAVGPTGR